MHQSTGRTRTPPHLRHLLRYMSIQISCAHSPPSCSTAIDIAVHFGEGIVVCSSVDVVGAGSLCVGVGVWCCSAGCVGVGLNLFQLTDLFAYVKRSPTPEESLTQTQSTKANDDYSDKRGCFLFINHSINHSNECINLKTLGVENEDNNNS